MARIVRRRLVPAVVATIALMTACGGEIKTQADPDDVDSVAQSVVSIAGVAAPPNPETGTQTPSELNRSDALAYRLPGVANDDVERVLILVPGFLGGANSFDYMARRIVLRTNGRTVVWAVERRSNALEDQTGLDAAERAGDPDVAKGYYFRGTTVDGQTFPGFLTDVGADLSYVSEWGIKTHIEDLDALVRETGRRYPGVPIFLGGHSLGASIVAIYAAWDFGGRAGFERLSGLALLEGTPSAVRGAIPDQVGYETRGISNGFGSTSLHTLRTQDAFVTLPFIGRDLYVTSEIVAMRASRLVGDPLAMSPDSDLVQQFFGLLFAFSTIPPMTNRAALGLGFDYDFQPLAFARASIGEAIGPTGPNPRAGLFAAFGADPAELRAPSDPQASYDWRPRGDMAQPEPTDLETFARVLFAGPSNFIEWYFPARLTFDAGFTASLDVRRSGDWRKDVYGMAVTENARVDVPVFAVGGGRGLVREAGRFDDYRSSISPTLRDGSQRSRVAGGFVAFVRPGFAHLDAVTAADEGAGNEVFGSLVEWMDAAARLAPLPAR